jgi:hypothetical protein
MSRSYRQPACAITGTSSAKQDKIHAHRGHRAAQKQALRECVDWDELLMPHRLECAGNETYSWGRDGKQSLQFPPTLSQYWFRNPEIAEEYYQDQLKWYQKLHRK